VNLRVARKDRRRDSLHVLTAADVTHLIFGGELLAERP
jgi:hypothetical protein